MKEDKMLRKRSLFVCIISCIFLSICIILQIALKSKGCLTLDLDIFLTISIAFSSGIFGSSFVLWFNKIFDYAAKKFDLLTDYFFITYKLTNVIANLQPSIRNQSKVNNSYKVFQDNRYLWNEMQHIYNKVESAKDNSEEMKIVTKINNKYKEMIPVIIFNAICIDLYFDDVNQMSQFKDNERKIFDIKVTKEKIIVDNNRCQNDYVSSYWPFTETEIIPQLQKLEKLLFGKETIETRNLPNAIIRNSEDL